MQELIIYRAQEVLTEKDFIEFAKTLKAVKMMRILYAVLIVLWVVLEILLAATSSDGTYAVAGSSFLFAFLIVFMILYPHILGKQSFQNSCKLRNSNPIFAEIILTENRIYDNTKNSSETFEYYQIQQVKQTKNLFVLTITDTTGIIIRKDSLQGDIANFENFINAKKYQQ